MKIISNVATLTMSFGLAVFAGSLLFSAVPLTALGWIVALPLFVGSTGIVAISTMNLLPEKYQVKKDEKNGYKTQESAA